MSDNSSIEWTDATWNPVTGCTKVSPGCDHCYAETFAERWRGTPGHHFENGFDVQLRPERLDQPLKWKKPRRIFVNSMSDLFHDKVSNDFIADVFAVMALTPQHTYQVLTKRHRRLRSLLDNQALWYEVGRKARHRGYGNDRAANFLADGSNVYDLTWWETHRQLPNVWIGVSVENQQWADIRIPALLNTPGAVRWISAEPLLGPVDLTYVAGINALEPDWMGGPTGGTGAPHPLLDWVVAGGESGPKARPMHPDWARSLRDQCVAAEVPFLFKQWGAWVPESMWLHRDTAPAAFLSTDATTRPLVNGKPTAAPMSRGKDITIRNVGKKAAGRELDGRTWDEYPTPAMAGAR